MGWLEEEYEVVAISSSGSEVEELRAGGMRVIEVTIARHISPWQDVKSLFMLWRVLRKEKPDMVHCMALRQKSSGMAN